MPFITRFVAPEHRPQRRRLPVLRALSTRVKQFTPVRALRRKRYERLFANTKTWRGLQHGLYRSFAEARRAAPRALPTGYILEDERFFAGARLETYDYPVMLWLAQLLPGAHRLFDFGGHVGVHYYGYRRYLQYPPSLRWVVCEQPQVVRMGEMLRAERKAAGLSFVTEWSEVDGSDILLSSGCIQFVEEPLAARLAALARRPQHVILNKLPLIDRETRVTLQNTGRSFSPCWLFNRKQLLEQFEQVGYRLIDEWSCPGPRLLIPFNPEHSVQTFTGLYLTRVRQVRQKQA